jgi:uncharacterized protein YutE (UPF0331/DUF86 family)
MERIKDKIGEISEYLEQLELFLPESIEEYNRDFKLKAACERYFEKIVEATVDLAFLVIKSKKMRIPKEDVEAFILLANKDIISMELANRLRKAKGMRNIIAHEYGKIDNEIVFNSITEELKRDVTEFIEIIKEAK